MMGWIALEQMEWIPSDYGLVEVHIARDLLATLRIDGTPLVGTGLVRSP